MTSLMARALFAPHHERMNTCLVCRTASDTLPLLTLEYRAGTFHICPQHLPVLIHQPQMLVGLLEGAEQFRPSEVQD